MIQPTDHGEATDQDDGPTGTFGSDRDRMHKRAHRRTREIYARQRLLVTRHGSTVSAGSSQRVFRAPGQDPARDPMRRSADAQVAMVISRSQSPAEHTRTGRERASTWLRGSRSPMRHPAVEWLGAGVARPACECRDTAVSSESRSSTEIGPGCCRACGQSSRRTCPSPLRRLYRHAT